MVTPEGDMPEVALTCSCGAGCASDLDANDRALVVVIRWMDHHEKCPSRFLTLDVLEVPDDASELDR